MLETVGAAWPAGKSRRYPWVVDWVAVRLIGDPNFPPDPCSQIRASVEVYDNFTGRTMVFIGNPNI